MVDLPEVPAPEPAVDGDDEETWLYASERSYSDQLASYQLAKCREEKDG